MRRSLRLALLFASIAPTALHAQQAPAPKPKSVVPKRKPVTPPPAEEGDQSDQGDIIITGNRKLPGSVVGDIPPEVQLGPADIRSYGVSSVSDLLTELAPQTGSGRGSGGPPVVLLNGKRISSFSEIRDLPTEAIARVDILPEEVALKYGYPADQKVVNIVLRNRFRAVTVELGERVATEGGRSTPNGAVDLLKINRTGRLSLHASYTSSAALFESQRSISALPSVFDPAGTILGSSIYPDGQIDPALSALVGHPVTSAGVPVLAAGGALPLSAFVPTANQSAGFDQGKYRTLLPETSTFQANAVLARTIFGNVNATFNGSIAYSDSTGAQGLPNVSLLLPAGNPFSPFGRTVVLDRAAAGFEPLAQRNSSLTAHLGSTMNGTIGTWRWSTTATYDRVDSETFTETGLDLASAQARLNANDPAFNPFGPIDPSHYGVLPANRGYSTSNAGAVDALFNGNVIKLPAGDVATSVRVGGSLSRLDSRSYRDGLTQQSGIERDVANGQVNVDIPLASKSKNVLPFLGDLSLNGNLALNQLSDFGTLTTVGYGANWSPLTGVRIITSVTDTHDAPSATQLGNPVVITPNVRVFDFVTGRTVSVSSTSGGNPFLVADTKHTLKLGLTLKPFEKKDFTLIASYVESSARNPSAGFPSATAAIEAAFPTRFARNNAGDLTAIDSRPINFARTERSELRWGFNFSQPLKSKLQKQIEAFRAGKGPNPFVGLRLPGGRRVPDGQAAGGTPGATGSGDAGPGATRSGGAGPDGGGQRGPGGFGGGAGRGGGGRGGGGNFGGGGGRIQIALYHTWHFTDTVVVAPGLAPIDLLNGGAIGSGGQSRHELEGQLGYSNNGLGARLSANWQSGTRVLGGTLANPNTLNFSSLATANVRLFADLSQQLQFIKKNPWAAGMRITLGVDNLFDTRQRVRDANGNTPVSYQPDYLDPLGRTIRLSVRKLFF